MAKQKKELTNKQRKKFLKELLTNRNRFTKLLKPRINYDSKYGLFSINWGKPRNVDSTIETNLTGSGDLLFDVTKDGVIVGIEFLDLKDVLEKFDTTKEQNLKRVRAQYKHGKI